MSFEENALFYPLAILFLVMLPPPAAWGPVATEPSPPKLTSKALKNSEYYIGIERMKVRLRDGVFDSGGSGRGHFRVEFEKAAFGNLNDDAAEDAAVIFRWSGGGHGPFVTLAAMINQDGKPHNVATTIISDKLDVTSIACQSKIIVIHMMDQGPGDGLSRATVPIVVKYQLLGGKLKKIGKESRREPKKRR